MEWSQPLFIAFMFAVVGNLFFISTKLAFSEKKPEIKTERWKKGKDQPVCNLCCCPYRMEFDVDAREIGRIVESFNNPASNQTRDRDDEAPPVS